MKNLVTKLVCIIAFLALCAWSIYPPSERIRLGKDLQGGVSLIYRIDVPEDRTTDREAVISQTISVLKDRVNPKGIFDISIQPLGLDRIEVVMPLPSDNVQKLNNDYQDLLRSLLHESQIVPGELEMVLSAGTAVERYCGRDATSDRCRVITDLQAAHDAQRDARQAVKDAVEAGAAEDELAPLEAAAARAEIRYEDLFGEAVGLSLDRARVVRVLGLPTEREKQLDASGKPIIDEATGEELVSPSPREQALARLEREYPNEAARIDEVVAAFDKYQDNRTGLDDPEDLIRLLRGAGELQYHITVDAGNPEGVNVADLRKQLQDGGPGNVDTTAAIWAPLNELKQWYDTDDQLAALKADPATFFAAPPRSFVVEFYEGEYYMLLYNLPAKRMTHADGDWSVTGTFRSSDQLGRPAVAFSLDTAGGTLMAKLTGAHVGKPMAIVLDGEVYSAPTLQSQISSNGIITGSFSPSEINYLIRVLAAGALEARLSEDPIAVNILGPTLGAENLKSGKYAFIIAIIAVAVFMLGYYFFAGLVADLALLANGLIIFGVMSMIDGTFTLPGLAGIVLTIGMAVDANVLIYERIREEIFAGEEDLRGAIRLGYAKALSTIIDANVTNLIVCFVLFYTATAEVKGFALTLTIGICATLFTALFVTRQVYYLYTEVFKAKRLVMLPTAVPAIHRMLEPSIRWIGLRKIFWAFSAVAVVTSLVLVASRGVDMFDTEFRGGVTATMYSKPVLDANGQPVKEQGEVVRTPLPKIEVEDRIRALADLAAPAGSAEAAVLPQFRSAIVQTQGAIQADAQGRTLATGFVVKVANPKGLDDENAMTQVVVDSIVEEFADQLDISPPLQFEGAGMENAANYVTPIEDDNLGKVIGEPSVTTRIRDFMGGVAIVIRNIDPPTSPEKLEERIEQMRNQPDFKAAVGRRTRVVTITPVSRTDPAGPARDVAVLSIEPNLSSLKVTSDVWFDQFAQPEWTLVSAALQRRSSLHQVSSFSPAVAETLSANAIVAVVLSLLGILIYIWVRFGSLRYSAAAIAALMHDVCVALGLLALSGYVAGTALGPLLGIEVFRIDLGVVAALLTIIGYSLNDTIVILDRIRENRGKRPLPSASIVNRSINQTVSRTLLTSVTTLMAVLIMYIEGGSGIRPFTFCLLVGLVVGTYSSVAIAAPLVYRRGTEHGDEETAGAVTTAKSATAAPESRTSREPEMA